MNKVNNGEVMLEEIYERLQITDYRLQIIESEELVELEKEIEAENLMVNRVILEEIERRREEGWMIAFISDMYLDAEFLSKILMREGCMKEGDRLFVSCEWGARKDTGELYDVVRRELKPTEWWHWGDNHRSDIEMARRKGVNAVWVDAKYTDAERGGTLCGYQRAARMMFGDDTFVTMAADFVAPAYVPYISWMLKQSTGVSRLYFLSRDSYVLMKGAEELMDYYPNIELRYLFVSRKSLFLPYLACNVSAEQMLSVMDKRTLYSKRVDELLRMLGTDREELKGMGIEFAYTKIENRAIEADFLTKIFDGEYRSLLIERAQEARELLLRYFEQEGVMDDVERQMVDVGWLGTTRLMINAILDSVGVRRVGFFYYGVRGDVFGDECGEYETYFQAGELSTMATALIENYFSASPYPTTVGYAYANGGKVMPIFPKGEQFCETEITKANCVAVALLTKWVYEFGFSEGQLRQWAMEQLHKMIDLIVRVDLMPLAVASEFDNTSFVRKMSRKELVQFAFLGAHITAFDKASLALTVGYRFMPY
ncbi:MAG: hypothetical protein IKT77_06395, partial [Paludibacteraceae bacterium]|nr:hypothetical protein [Paludibacteraceae bacterium]